MSCQTTVINLIVVHEGKHIVFDSQAVPMSCDTIREIKREIERVHCFSIGSQLISIDNILLPENIRLEDLKFKYTSKQSSGGNSNSTANLNRPIKLTLTTPKGQVNIKVNIISDQIEPINLSVSVHGTTSVYQLRELLLEKLPQDMRDRDSAQIVLSIKKK